MKYQTFTENDSDYDEHKSNLKESVNELSSKGRTPQGGVSAATEKQAYYVLCQAMLMRE